MNIKTKLGIATALAVACSAWLGYPRGLPKNDDATVTFHIKRIFIHPQTPNPPFDFEDEYNYTDSVERWRYALEVRRDFELKTHWFRPATISAIDTNENYRWTSDRAARAAATCPPPRRSTR